MAGWEGEERVVRPYSELHHAKLELHYSDSTCRHG